MKCPICENELRQSTKEPSYGLCDYCKKKFKLPDAGQEDNYNPGGNDKGGRQKMAFGVKDVLNGARAVAGSNIFQGGLGNYSEMNLEHMKTEYGMYLMDSEQITVGFKLVRDALIFTDKRIIFTDKQGATGTKMHIKSINLFSVVDVTMETAGFGFDDSELTFTYIKTADLKAHEVHYVSHKLEFPKKYNVQPLYKLLQELAYSNCVRINDLA